MIVKIDHIAISTPKSKEFISLIEKLGYKVNFIENDIRNMKIKRELMKKFPEKHKLTLCSLDNSFSFEIIDYDKLNNNYSYVLPVFTGLADNLWAEENNKNDIVDLLKIKKGKLDNLDLPVYIEENKLDKVFKFHSLIIKTEDIHKSVNFWKNFGFIKSEKGRDYAKLEYSSILDSNKYKIYLILSNDVKRPHLDDAGFNCIALVSSSATDERERLIKEGIEVTNIESIKVNNRRLKIFFALGPYGELVEVISPETE